MPARYSIEKAKSVGLQLEVFEHSSHIKMDSSRKFTPRSLLRLHLHDQAVAEVLCFSHLIAVELVLCSKRIGGAATNKQIVIRTRTALLAGTIMV